MLKKATKLGWKNLRQVSAVSRIKIICELVFLKCETASCTKKQMQSIIINIFYPVKVVLFSSSFPLGLQGGMIKE